MRQSAQDTDVCADPSYRSAHSRLKTLKPNSWVLWLLVSFLTVFQCNYFNHFPV